MKARKITIQQIAQELSISKSTVSKALNGYKDVSEGTKCEVIAKAKELGYAPDYLRRLIISSSNTVGLVLRDINSIYGEFFSKINEAAREKGLIVITCDCKRDPELELKYVKSLIDAKVKGLLVASVDGNYQAINDIVQRQLPVIYFGEKVTADSENYIITNSRKGMNMAVNYLVGLGHEKIVFLCGSTQSASKEMRIESYTKSVKQHELKDTVLFYDGQKSSVFDEGFKIGQKLISDGLKYTAVICAKDVIALGCIKAFQIAGYKVPEDISVVGCDGADISGYPFFNLTTIKRNRSLVAKEMIDMLIEQADSNGPMVSRHILIDPELAIGDSSAPVNSYIKIS